MAHCNKRAILAFAKINIMKYPLAFILIFCSLQCMAQSKNDLLKEGVDHMEKHEYSKAAKIFEEATRLAGEDADFATLANLAYSQLMTGETEKAIANYSKALSLKPGEHAILFQRANAYMRLGMYDNAIEDCTGIVNESPDNTDAQLTLAHAYCEKGDNKRAKELFVNIMTLKPNENNAKLGLTHIYRKEGKYNDRY